MGGEVEEAAEVTLVAAVDVGKRKHVCIEMDCCLC